MWQSDLTEIRGIRHFEARAQALHLCSDFRGSEADGSQVVHAARQAGGRGLNTRHKENETRRETMTGNVGTQLLLRAYHHELSRSAQAIRHVHHWQHGVLLQEASVGIVLL